jgi:Holliday junction DNA helicase RuvB
MPRPKASCFREFLGQPRLTRYFVRLIRSARSLGRALPHHLLIGPVGTGKTSLCRAVAKEFGSAFVELAAVAGVDEAAKKLRDLATGDVIFIDEIHRASLELQEFLLHPLQDNELLLPQTQREMLREFTLLAATSRPGRVREALRSRMTIEHVDEYRAIDLKEIAERYALTAHRRISPQAANRLARLPRMTPRRVVQFVSALELWTSEVDIGVEALDDMCAARGIDDMGLEPHHRRYLRLLAESDHHSSSISRLASLMSYDDHASVRDDVEAPLLHLGLIDISLGHQRRLTRAGHDWVRRHPAGDECDGPADSKETDHE